MKKIYLFGLGLVAVISAAIAYFVFQSKNAAAGDLTFEERLNQPPLQTPFPEGATPVPVEDNGKDRVSDEQIATNEAILADIEQITEKANETYRAQGWWHYEYQVFYISSDPQSNNQPNGNPMPQEWKEESWFLVDEKGYVVESVGIQSASDGAVMQISAYKDGVVTNFSYDMTWKEEPQLLMIGSGIDISGMDINTITMDSKEELLGNESVIGYTLSAKSTPLTVVNGQLIDSASVDNPVVESLIQSYMSKETGLRLLYEAYNIFADGTSQLVHRINTISYEKISEPPVDILKYLQ